MSFQPKQSNLKIMDGLSSTLTSIFLDVYRRQTSFQSYYLLPIEKELSIREVLEEIKSNKYEQQVLKLRSLLKEGQKENYTINKKSLPAVTFCGTFERDRKSSNLKIYNSILVIDVDNVETNILEKYKKVFFAENFIFSFWESPSGKGLKGLINLKFNFEINHFNVISAHKGAFIKIEEYFRIIYDIDIDKSGSDICRLCFLSHDPNIVIKETMLSFEINNDDLIPNSQFRKSQTLQENISFNCKNLLFNPQNKNKPSDRYTMALIIKYLFKNKLSITYPFESWYRVAMAIANTFTYDIGEKYFLKLSSLDQGKFNETGCINFLKKCYVTKNGSINFNTIVYLAQQQKFKTKVKKERGSEMVD